MACTWRVLPSRSRPSVTSLPSGSRPSLLRSSSLSRSGLPLSVVSTSPGSMPAAAAGEPSLTRVTTAPSVLLTPSSLAMRGVMSCVCTPRLPRCTLPCAMSCFITSPERLVGIAKPMPALAPEGEKIIELMPTNSPRRFTSAPPELPGLIEASVWMKFW